MTHVLRHVSSIANSRFRFRKQIERNHSRQCQSCLESDSSVTSHHSNRKLTLRCAEDNISCFSIFLYQVGDIFVGTLMFGSKHLRKLATPSIYAATRAKCLPNFSPAVQCNTDIFQLDLDTAFPFTASTDRGIFLLRMGLTEQTVSVLPPATLSRISWILSVTASSQACGRRKVLS